LLKRRLGVLFEWKGKSRPIFDGLCNTTLNARHAVGKPSLAVFLSFRNHLDFERCGLLGFYAASSGNALTMFRDDLSVISSRLKKFSETRWLLKTGRNLLGILDPWKCNRWGGPKCRYGIPTRRCVKSQKRACLIYMAEVAWNHAFRNE